MIVGRVRMVRHGHAKTRSDISMKSWAMVAGFWKSTIKHAKFGKILLRHDDMTRGVGTHFFWFCSGPTYYKWAWHV